MRQIRRSSLPSQTRFHRAAPRSRLPFLADCLERVHRMSGSKSFLRHLLRRVGRVGPTHGRIPLCFHHRLTCFWPEPSACLSREAHGQIHPCLPGLDFTKDFRSLNRRFGESPCRSDDLKLLRFARFDKLPRGELSTFPRIRCGGGWISPPSVAEI